MATPMPVIRSDSRLAGGLVAATGAAIVLVSLLPAWIVHLRHIGGHGLTAITATWSAWDGRAWPVLTAAVVLAGLTAVAGALRAWRPGLLPASIPLVGSAATLALLASGAVPVGHAGFVTQVEMTAAWGLVMAIGLASAMLVVAWLAAGAGADRRARGGPRLAAFTTAGIVLLAAGGVGARVVALDIAEGDPRHYADATYVREPTADGADLTLTFDDGTLRVADRWAGTLEERGLVVVITGDPACPETRGTYRVFAAGEDAIRWNTIIDQCAGGARAGDLTAGTWHRVP